MSNRTILDPFRAKKRFLKGAKGGLSGRCDFKKRRVPGLANFNKRTPDSSFSGHSGHFELLQVSFPTIFHPFWWVFANYTFSPKSHFFTVPLGLVYARFPCQNVLQSLKFRFWAVSRGHLTHVSKIWPNPSRKTVLNRQKGRLEI